MERTFYQRWCEFFMPRWLHVNPNKFGVHSICGIGVRFLFIMRLHIIARSKNHVNLCVIAQYHNPSWSFIKRQTSSTSSDNGWQRVTKNGNEWQRMTTSGNEWYNEWQRATTSGTTNGNEWQRGTISANFSFFQIRREATTKHPKEKSLNIEEDLWRRPIESRAETRP